MGSRWGEEEKKSKGIFGCLISVFVLAVFSYGFYVNYRNLEGRRSLEKAMQDCVRSGYSKSEKEMIGEIQAAADELSLVLPDGAIFLEKYRDDNSNPVVNVRIEYEFKVDLFVTSFDVSLPIAEEVTIVTF